MSYHLAVKHNLKVLTWNLWFGEFELMARLEAALAIIRSHDPDVIALQEVVPETLEHICDTPWIRDGYHLSDSTGETIEGYGTVLLTRVLPAQQTILDFPSVMGRKLVSADIPVGTSMLRVGTVHLESLESTPARLDQLDISFPFLREADAAILMGDFNFDPADPEEAFIPEDFTDLWALLHPESNGWTRDTDANVMAALFSERPKARRIDRILLRSGTTGSHGTGSHGTGSHRTGWRGTEIQLVGTKPCTADDPTLFPSDHFGLVACLEMETPPQGCAALTLG